MKDHFFCLHVVSLPINYKKNLILIKELEKLVVSAAMFLPPTFFGRSDGYIFRRPFPSIIFPLSIWIAQPTSDNRSPSPLVSPADSGVSPSASSCLSSLASEGRGGGGDGSIADRRRGAPPGPPRRAGVRREDVPAWHAERRKSPGESATDQGHLARAWVRGRHAEVSFRLQWGRMGAVFVPLFSS